MTDLVIPHRPWRWPAKAQRAQVPLSRDCRSAVLRWTFGTVSGGATLLLRLERTDPQCSRWSNPAARRIRIPAREGADVGGWSAQAFARVANCEVSPQLLPAPNVTLDPVASRNRNRRAWTCTQLGLVGRGVRAMAQRCGEGAAVSCPRHRDGSRIAVHRTRLAMG